MSYVLILGICRYDGYLLAIFCSDVPKLVDVVIYAKSLVHFMIFSPSKPLVAVERSVLQSRLFC